MNAPLRWTAALAAVGVLGFAAGRYFGTTEELRLSQLSFPVVAPDGSAPFASTPAVAAQRPVPRTLREILKLHGDFTQSAALYVLAASSDKKGIERLLDETETIDRESERRAAATILYQRYAELDPGAAVEHMMNREAGLDTNWLYAVFYSWARTDVNGALARAAKLDDRNRSMAGTAIVRSRDDLPTAEREALGSKLNLHVAVRDPSTTDMRAPKAAEQAWRNALAVRDREARQSGLYMVARDWTMQDPHAAIRAIESLQNRSERDQLLQHAVQTWSEKNPREAVEWVFERPPSMQRTQLLAQALSAFVTQEPTSAVTMLDRLSPGERQHMMPQVLMTWASADPQAAAAWLEKQDDPQTYQRALGMIASVYVERDPDEALRWAATLSEENEQMVMGVVIQRMAQDDPEQAAGMIGRLKEGPARDNGIMAVASIWAQSDPRAALSWVERQPRSDSTPMQYRAVFEQWIAYDPDAAISQLNFILDASTRNAAILGILEGWNLDSSLVDRLYQRLEGAEARSTAAAQLFYRLRETDPQAAERYRSAAGITEGESLGEIVVN